MPRLLFVFLFLVARWGLLAAPDLEQKALLDRYVGEWEGRFVVKTTEGKILSRIESRAVYRWEGDLVFGRVIHGVGEKVTVQEVQVGFRDDGRLWMTMETGSKTSRYLGSVEGNAFKWAPADGTAKRIAADYFLITETGVPQIAVRSAEEIALPEGESIVVQVEGFLLPLDRPKEPMPEGPKDAETTDPAREGIRTGRR